MFISNYCLTNASRTSVSASTSNFYRLTNASDELSSHKRKCNSNCIVSQQLELLRLTIHKRKCNPNFIVSQSQVLELHRLTNASATRTSSSHKRKCIIVSQTKVLQLHRLTNESATSAASSHKRKRSSCIVSQTSSHNLMSNCIFMSHFHVALVEVEHADGLPTAAVTSPDFLRRFCTDKAPCCGLNVEPLFFRSERSTPHQASRLSGST